MIMEAAETERRLPPAIRKQKLASWPEYQTEWLSYGTVVYVPSLPKATTLQITKYEHTLDLLLEKCSDTDRRLLWAVAHSGAFRQRGPKWSVLARAYHQDRRTVKRNYLDALIRLHYTITQKKPSFVRSEV